MRVPKPCRKALAQLRASAAAVALAQGAMRFSTVLSATTAAATVSAPRWYLSRSTPSTSACTMPKYDPACTGGKTASSLMLAPNRSLTVFRYCSCVRRVSGASPGSGAAALHESALVPAVPVGRTPVPAVPVPVPGPVAPAAPGAAPVGELPVAWPGGPLIFPVQAPSATQVRPMACLAQRWRTGAWGEPNISTSD